MGFAIYILSALLLNPASNILYLAQTSKVARLYIWVELRRLCDRYDLPFTFTQNLLWITHKRTGGKIVLAGVDNADEIEKFRGPHWLIVGLDEAASFGAHIESLILEVVGPALRDHNGTLIMIGTAGRLKAGLFYEATHGLRKRKDGEPVYKVFKWTLHDNPHLPDDAKDEQLICDDEGLTLTDPRFLREYRGIWVTGENERVFSGFCDIRNVYNAPLPSEHRWLYLMGADFGWSDETAITVIAYSKTSPVMYMMESWSKRHTYADDVAARIMHYRMIYGAGAQIVGDVGGYGKAIQVQLLRDYKILVQTAKKYDKLNFIEFQNSAFLRGEIMIPSAEKRMIQQLNEVAWNESRTDSGNHERDDLVFSLTYAWRYAKFAGAGRETLASRDTMDPLDRRALSEKQQALGETSAKKVWWEQLQSDGRTASIPSQWSKTLGHGF